jgi:response regulator RpfG family c-di-GMP phosphodiesterase
MCFDTFSRELKLSEAEIKHAGAAISMHDLGKIKSP